MSGDPSQRPRPETATTVFLGAVVLLAVAIGLWFVVQRGPRPADPNGAAVPGALGDNSAGEKPADGSPAPPPRSPEQWRALVEKKNRGLGLLDNEKLADADVVWSELAAELPDDPLPARNLAVCRLLSLKGG